MYDLRMEIFSHLQRLSISYFDRNPVGRLMTRVTSDVETLNELFSSGVVTVFGDVFTLLAIMTMMLLVDWRLALVTFSVIPLVWLTASIFRRRVREAWWSSRDPSCWSWVLTTTAPRGSESGPSVVPKNRL
jgi:ATP-binding cassette subfamily B protein